MTHPANKKRTHNAAARDAARSNGDVAVRGTTPTRNSRYGAKLRALKEDHE